MAYAAAEDKSPEFTSSDVSLHEPNINKSKRASASFPLIKPDLSSKALQNVAKIFKQIGKVCYQQFKMAATKSIQQKDNLSLDESKNVIRDLAAELDRVLQDSVHRQWVNSKQRSENTVGLHIPNSVWNWITKSTAVVILDPNTANPELLVSENGKSLKAKQYSSLSAWEEFQWKRSKYDGWMCVQAKEGYNTGSHYWEVDVKKKREWRVGVVKESAPRNGYVTMNAKSGYWNLSLQLGTLMALTEPVTKLNLPTPSKIGVYLDVDEGHVSFYDAEKRQHIYTFNTDFNETGNIYPMFGTVETDRALVISS